MVEHEPIHVLPYGFSASKKSTLAATFPIPLYVAMFDAYGMDGPYLRAGDEVKQAESKLAIPIRRVFRKGKLVAELHYYHDPDPTAPDAWALFCEEQSTFNPNDWATWVGDSVSQARDAAFYDQQYRINKNGNGMQWWGGATDQLSIQFKSRLASYPCNVVLIAHIERMYVTIPAFKGQAERKVDKRTESAVQDDSGQVMLVRGIAAPGRLSKSDGLVTNFAEVYRCYVERDKSGQRVWRMQTEPDEEYIAKTQIPAPDGCGPSYEEIWKGVGR